MKIKKKILKILIESDNDMKEVYREIIEEELSQESTPTSQKEKSTDACLHGGVNGW